MKPSQPREIDPEVSLIPFLETQSIHAGFQYLRNQEDESDFKMNQDVPDSPLVG